MLDWFVCLWKSVNVTKTLWSIISTVKSYHQTPLIHFTWRYFPIKPYEKYYYWKFYESTINTSRNKVFFCKHWHNLISRRYRLSRKSANLGCYYKICELLQNLTLNKWSFEIEGLDESIKQVLCLTEIKTKFFRGVKNTLRDTGDWRKSTSEIVKLFCYHNSYVVCFDSCGKAQNNFSNCLHSITMSDDWWHHVTKPSWNGLSFVWSTSRVRWQKSNKRRHKIFKARFSCRNLKRTNRKRNGSCGRVLFVLSGSNSQSSVEGRPKLTVTFSYCLFLAEWRTPNFQ